MRLFKAPCMSDTLSASFRRLAWSNLLAQSAEQLSLAAVPIVAVLLLKAGPGEIGLLATIQSLPFLLLSMPLGLLADRTSRTRLMALAETLRAVALLLLLALIVTGNVSIPALAVIGFIAAVGTVAAVAAGRQRSRAELLQLAVLLPGAMLTADVTPMVPGKGLLQCHVDAHAAAGMAAAGCAIDMPAAAVR